MSIAKKITLILVLSSIFIGLFIAWIISIAVEKTSDAEFCGKCHTMKPIVASYYESKHGGNNSVGFRAKCTDCHLPQDGTIKHLYVKTLTGLKDIYGETFKNAEDIDWEDIRTNREKFTYDSGCIKCHQNFDVIHAKDKHAQDAHDYYNANKDKHSCTLCHKNVGHHELSKFLNQ